MNTFVTTLLAPALILFQDGAPPATPVVAPAPLFDLWIDDVSSMLVSPKDAGLLRALSMFDARLLELPSELDAPMEQLPPQMLPLLSRFALGGKSLRVFAATDRDAALPFTAHFEMHERSAENAKRLAELLFDMLVDSGAPLGSPGPDGLAYLELPDGPPIEMGAVGKSLVFNFGGAAAEPSSPRWQLLPDGARPMLTLHADVGQSLRIFGDTLKNSTAADVEKMLAAWRSAGLTDMVVDMAIGSDAERMHSVVRLPGQLAQMRRNGLVAARMLNASDFATVPVDAEWALLTTINAGGTLEYMLSSMRPALREQGIEDPLAELESATGFDLRADIFNHIGSTLAVYTSKSTGGGGVLSTVAVLELANRDGLAATLERVKAMVNDAGASQARGYVRMRTFEVNGDTLHSLVFPGLPIPLELTLALGTKHLVAGLTPQAVLGALAQIRRGDAGLLANTAFTGQLPCDAIGAASAQFVDVSAMASDAYGLTSLMCAALANAMRSPGTERDPGLVMPTYHAFIEGARATATIGRFEGDDFVQRGIADRSMLVNAAGSIGMLAASPAGLLVGVGILGGAVSQSLMARSAAADMQALGYVDDVEDEPVPAVETKEY